MEDAKATITGATLSLAVYLIHAETMGRDIGMDYRAMSLLILWGYLLRVV